VPKTFSWVDHRLVRERYIDQCSHGALALYLFLVTVGDTKGLSYYSKSTLTKRLSMNDEALCQARSELIKAGLLAYQRPIYQVLALGYERTSSPSPTRGNPQAFIKILKQTLEKSS